MLQENANIPPEPKPNTPELFALAGDDLRKQFGIDWRAEDHRSRFECFRLNR
jgi:hypothetical protein